jgi:hypothetical protein
MLFLLQTNITNRCLASTRQKNVVIRILAAVGVHWHVHTLPIWGESLPNLANTVSIKDLWAYSAEPRHRTAGTAWDGKEKRKRKRRI